MHFKYLTVLFSYVSITLGFPCGLVVKNPPTNAEDPRDMGSVPGPLGWNMDGGDSLMEEMATDSSILAWRISWTLEPGRLESIGLQRVRHD